MPRMSIASYSKGVQNTFLSSRGSSVRGLPIFIGCHVLIMSRTLLPLPHFHFVWLGILPPIPLVIKIIYLVGNKTSMVLQSNVWLQEVSFLHVCLLWEFTTFWPHYVLSALQFAFTLTCTFLPSAIPQFQNQRPYSEFSGFSDLRKLVVMCQ
jgi:hypothetical protein